MKFVLERVTGPEIEPVTLAELKARIHTFASSTGEDDDLTALIKVGREWVERETGRVLVDQTFRLTIKTDPVLQVDTRGNCSYSSIAIPSYIAEIALRKSPVLAITSFVSVASTGVETTIAASTYELREPDSKWPRVVAIDGSTWGDTEYRITFRAGYSDQTGSPQDGTDVIPYVLKTAVMLYAQSVYDMNPDIEDIAKRMIKSERVELGMA